MNEIQSTKNPYIKELKKLHTKKGRDRQNQYIIEGFHLVEEAFKANADIRMVLLSPRGMREWNEWATQQELPMTFVSEEVMNELSDLPTPQGMCAIVRLPEEKDLTYRGKWLLLDGVQDPGNVGTMIRTADAAGFSGVILGEGSADIYGSKVLRSMQGSQYHLEIVRSDMIEAIENFKMNQVPVYGTELNEDASVYHTVEKSVDIALVLGNEGQGVSKEVLACTNKNLYIPIYGKAESLNVGIAAGILMYHFS